MPPPELQSRLSDSSALSPANHGAHVTPRAAIHLLADESAAAVSAALDQLKPECPQCDELRRQQKSARSVHHAATVQVADLQGSWRLLQALASCTGRLLGNVFTEAVAGTRSKRTAVSVEQLFHQVPPPPMLPVLQSQGSEALKFIVVDGAVHVRMHA